MTDHHTVDALDEAKAYGKEKGITVISGIEFRTEYGQKSVHMIGLFPDYFKGQKLDQSALNDLILAPLDLSRTQIIMKGKENHPEYSNEKAYKEGLLRVQVDFKNAADLIHKYGGIVTVHAGGKANSFDVEMRHEGTGVTNVDLADSLFTASFTSSRAVARPSDAVECICKSYFLHSEPREFSINIFYPFFYIIRLLRLYRFCRQFIYVTP